MQHNFAQTSFKQFYTVMLYIRFQLCFPSNSSTIVEQNERVIFKVLFHVRRIHYECWILQRLQGNGRKMQRRWKR